MGILRALAGGIEGKFKRPLERATALDESYDHGNIPAIWPRITWSCPGPSAIGPGRRSRRGERWR